MISEYGYELLISKRFATKAACKAGIPAVQESANNESNYIQKEDSNDYYSFNFISTDRKLIGKSLPFASFAVREFTIHLVMTQASQSTIDSTLLSSKKSIMEKWNGWAAVDY